MNVIEAIGDYKFFSFHSCEYERRLDAQDFPQPGVDSK